jgi:hypothetical protein
MQKNTAHKVLYFGRPGKIKPQSSVFLSWHSLDESATELFKSVQRLLENHGLALGHVELKEVVVGQRWEVEVDDLVVHHLVVPNQIIGRFTHIARIVLGTSDHIASVEDEEIFVTLPILSVRFGLDVEALRLGLFVLFLLIKTSFIFNTQVVELLKILCLYKRQKEEKTEGNDLEKKGQGRVHDKGC